KRHRMPDDYRRDVQLGQEIAKLGRVIHKLRGRLKGFNRLQASSEERINSYKEKINDYHEAFSRPAILATCEILGGKGEDMPTLARAFDIAVDGLVNRETAQLRAKLEEVTRERDALRD